MIKLNTLDLTVGGKVGFEGEGGAGGSELNV